MTPNRLSPRAFIITFGVVSMLGDFVYEGARSVAGPYLATLGAGALAVGFISGGGEAVALVFRLASGPLADRVRRYWAIAIAGYAITLVAVPLLALAGSLVVAALLLTAERFGKAVRSPSRDTLLAHASASMGRGWGFAVHEALDQVGALVGPLVVALVLGLTARYSLAFAILAVPGAAALILVVVLRRAVPDPAAYDRAARHAERATGAHAGGFGRRFWWYSVFTALTMGGFATFALFSYHLTVRHVLALWAVPLLYAAAMGMAAVGALVSGRAYDHFGLRTLIVLPPIGAVLPFLLFTTSAIWVWVGALLWGVAMGMHESTMRAAVAHLVPAGRRATGYGVFTSVYGLAWLVGSVAIGAAYGAGIDIAIAVMVGIQVLAIASFIPVWRQASAPA